MTGLWVPTCEKATWEAHAGIWRVFVRLDFTSHFATQAKSQVTHKTLCLMILSVSFHIPLQILYKPSLPTKFFKKKKVFSKKLLRKKTLAKHLRVRDCLPTIIYTASLKFLLLLSLHLHILERFLTQTLTSPILSVERSFGVYGKQWKKTLSGGCNLELIAGSEQLVKTWLCEAR